LSIKNLCFAALRPIIFKREKKKLKKKKKESRIKGAVWTGLSRFLQKKYYPLRQNKLSFTLIYAAKGVEIFLQNSS